MNSVLIAFFAVLASSFRTSASLRAEVLALRHQLAVLQANAPPRLRLKRSDRVLWVLLSRWFPGWRQCLRIIQPATVDHLAPQSLCVVLDPEITAPTGKAASNGRDSCFDPAHEPDQSIVGSAAYSRGTAQVRNRSCGIHGWQIPAASPQAAFTDLAGIPE